MVVIKAKTASNANVFMAATLAGNGGLSNGGKAPGRFKICKATGLK
jgi:hypothetical protein